MQTESNKARHAVGEPDKFTSKTLTSLATIKFTTEHLATSNNRPHEGYSQAFINVCPRRTLVVLNAATSSLSKVASESTIEFDYTAIEERKFRKSILHPMLETVQDSTINLSTFNKEMAKH